MEAGSAAESTRRANVISRLAPGEWLALAASLALLLALLALDWFAYSAAERAAPRSEGDAFRWLDGPDQVILVCALLALAATVTRMTLTRVPARDAAIVSGAAGLLASALIASAIISPPGLEPSELSPLAGAEGGLEVRAGTVAGLLSALAIVAGSALSLMRAPARAFRPKPQPRPARKAATKTEAGRQAEPKPGPTPPAEPKSPVRPTSRAKPRPRRRPAPAPAKLSLASASEDDLIRAGFTETQAKRIVSYRDEEAIVTKVADLKRVPGIARPVLAKLVERLDD